MGKEYYVLTASAGELIYWILLTHTLLTKDESVTIGGKVVTVTYISSTATEGVKF